MNCHLYMITPIPSECSHFSSNGKSDIGHICIHQPFAFTLKCNMSSFAIHHTPFHYTCSHQYLSWGVDKTLNFQRYLRNPMHNKCQIPTSYVNRNDFSIHLNVLHKKYVLQNLNILHRHNVLMWTCYINVDEYDVIEILPGVGPHMGKYETWNNIHNII